MRYRRRGRSLSQQRAEGLALVEAKGRDVDQADDIRRVCAQRTDDLASVGVAGDDGWPVLTSQHLTQARDAVSYRRHGKRRGRDRVATGLQARDHCTPAGTLAPCAIDEYDGGALRYLGSCFQP